MERHADVTAFLREYEGRTNSHDTKQLVPLIADDAVYWFTDGSHRGRDAILAAIDETWRAIRDETYEIRDVEVVVNEPDAAVLRYTFHWSGIVGGEQRSGSGRGTNVAIRRGGRWLMLHEHLSR